MALGNYMTQSVSSSVSLKFGDSGDNMVVFPVLTFCKALELKTGLWRGINKTCKGEAMTKLPPPLFISYIKECLEVDETLEVEDIINHLTYDVDEVINNALFKNPEFPEGVEVHNPIIGGNGPDWSTVKHKILSSHYDLHFGHCYNLDFSPLSPYNNGKFLINQGVSFVFARVSVNVYPELKTMKRTKRSPQNGDLQPQNNRSIDQSPENGSGPLGLNGPPGKGKRRPQDNLEKGIFGSANKACSNCEKIPFAIFINNGTDIDRLGENIVQRDLDIGRHNVSTIQKRIQ